MVRRRREEEAESGHESFLDVVSNVVGILIILVLIIGERIRQAPPQEFSTETKAAQASAAALAADVYRLAGQLKTVQGEVMSRGRERAELGTLVAAQEKQLDARRNELDEESRRRYDVQRSLDEARRELQRLEQEREQAQVAAAPSEIKVECYPTPLSKPVDDREVHFQLVGGRLTYIPLEDLIVRLKAEAHDRIWKLRDAPETTDMVGPIGGFHLRYTLERIDDGSSHTSGVVQLSHWELIPVSRHMGERLDVALASSSEFRAKLGTLDPHRWTITVWVYPDSFADFRRLKKELYQLGYATAGRPLPEGMPIGGSPSGSKSAAE